MGGLGDSGYLISSLYRADILFSFGSCLVLSPSRLGKL